MSPFRSGSRVRSWRIADIDTGAVTTPISRMDSSKKIKGVAVAAIVLAVSGCAPNPWSGCLSLLCQAKYKNRAARDLGLPQIDAVGPVPGSRYLIVAMNSDGVTLPAIMFSRSSDDVPARVEIRAPRRMGIEPIGAPIGDADWKAVQAAFRRGATSSWLGQTKRAVRRFTGQGRSYCEDGTSYELSVFGRGRLGRFTGEGCGDAGEITADQLAFIAVDAVPPCKAVTRGWSIFQDLNKCFSG
jgi:hypothetical protein